MAGTDGVGVLQDHPMAGLVAGHPVVEGVVQQHPVVGAAMDHPMLSMFSGKMTKFLTALQSPEKIDEISGQMSQVMDPSVMTVPSDTMQDMVKMGPQRGAQLSDVLMPQAAGSMSADPAMAPNGVMLPDRTVMPAGIPAEQPATPATPLTPEQMRFMQAELDRKKAAGVPQAPAISPQGGKGVGAMQQLAVPPVAATMPRVNLAQLLRGR